MPGRYTIVGTLAQGGMGRVWLGRLTGSAGFSRPVAIKRLHPALAAEREFVAMLVDEARLAARIRHTNVVDTLDLVASDGAFSLVLEYIEGESLSALVRDAREVGEAVPERIALAILYGVLRGLEAAHETRSDDGQPLGIVHRDVSPHNVLVGVDGIPRVIDFGVAKAVGRFESTRPGEVRGKFGYMAPEQVLGRPVTRQVDVYAAGVILWELLTGDRLFEGDDSRAVCDAVVRGQIRRPSAVRSSLPAALDAVVLRATARDLGTRYLTARDMLADLEPFARASDDEVGAWVCRLAAKTLAERQRILTEATPAVGSQTVDDLMAELARSVSTSGDAPVESAEAAATPRPSAAMIAEPPEQRKTTSSRSASGVALPPPRSAPTARSAVLLFSLGLVAAVVTGLAAGAAGRGASVAQPRAPAWPSAPSLPPAEPEPPAAATIASATIELDAPPPPAAAPSSRSPKRAPWRKRRIHDDDGKSER